MFYCGVKFYLSTEFNLFLVWVDVEGPFFLFDLFFGLVVFWSADLAFF